MDYDGSNQKQMTQLQVHFQAACRFARRKNVRFRLRWSRIGWQIMVHSAETWQANCPTIIPVPPTIETPEFTPDGQRISVRRQRRRMGAISACGRQRRELIRFRTCARMEVSPKVNPKTGRDMLFISGRSGIEQLWQMNIDGGDVERVTNGEGYVANPAWSPNGQTIAFAWTQAASSQAHTTSSSWTWPTRELQSAHFECGQE